VTKRVAHGGGGREEKGVIDVGIHEPGEIPTKKERTPPHGGGAYSAEVLVV